MLATFRFRVTRLSVCCRKSNYYYYYGQPQCYMLFSMALNLVTHKHSTQVMILWRKKEDVIRQNKNLIKGPAQFALFSR
jgi:hypothetical protein